MRVQLKNQLGTTDEISAGFAKKVIESGIYGKDDWISIDGGPWKSCSKINDINFDRMYPENGLVPGICKIYYDEKIYNSFQKLCNGNEELIYDMTDDDNLSELICYQITTTGVITYFIFISKDSLSIVLNQLNRLNIKKTISCFAEDELGNIVNSMNDYYSDRDDSNVAPSFYLKTNKVRLELEKQIEDLQAQVAAFCNKAPEDYDDTTELQEADGLSLEDIKKRICSPSHDNSINITANVRLEDGTPGLIDFKIPSIIINRIGKYLFVGDQYDEDFILKNNNEALFIANTEDEDNYVPSNMPFEGVVDDHGDDTQINNEEGCVYILVNESFPDLVKIGRTGGSVSARLQQLNSTGIPTPFECHYAAYVSDMYYVEKHLHEHFSDFRVNEKREFFKISPKEVHKILSQFAIGDATFS